MNQHFWKWLWKTVWNALWSNDYLGVYKLVCLSSILLYTQLLQAVFVFEGERESICLCICECACVSVSVRACVFMYVYKINIYFAQTNSKLLWLYIYIKFNNICLCHVLTNLLKVFLGIHCYETLKDCQEFRKIIFLTIGVIMEPIIIRWPNEINANRNENVELNPRRSSMDWSHKRSPS
jgi:hypothetical protein